MTKNCLKLRRLLFKGIFYRVIYFISLFILTLLMSRYYQAPGSGLIYYNITILSLVILLLSFCLEVAMNYYLASGKMSSGKLTGLALAWTCLAAIISYFILKLIVQKSVTSLSISFFHISIIFMLDHMTLFSIHRIRFILSV